MSKGNTFETELLQHIFQNADIANIGDATGLRGSSAPGNLYVALHTANPDEGGAQNTSEVSYTGYARVAVERSSDKWTVSGNEATNAEAVAFGECTAGSATATHFSVGTASSGAGKILYKGALGSPLAISENITPSFDPGELDITED